MKVSYIVKRYIAILGRLSNQKKATFQQLMDAIERMGGEDMKISQRTFQRMINDIEELFQVVIKCNREGFYYILESESDMENSKITQSLQFFNYQKYLENFENKIAYDKSCLIGQQFLYDIQNAIKEKKTIRFDYTKYNQKENVNEIRDISPYGLKEYKGRWYLVGLDNHKNEIRIFGLDRITNLIESETRMVSSNNFNIHNYFKHSIGISVDNDDISEFVELEFSSKLAGYIRNFPLHPSQVILSENSNGIAVKLRTYINLELVNELMQFSDDIKIIKPARLKKMMIKRHQEFLKNNQ
ncbi:MAG: WYL domain-containing protein [Chitinophagales bacterium]|nr:WYL domain-containing protein [Chitinophagales bacterium]